MTGYLELDSDKDTAIRVYVGHDGNAPAQDPFAPALSVTVKINWIAAELPIVGALLPSAEMSQTFKVPWLTDFEKLRDNPKGSATFIVSAAELGKPNRKKVLYVDAEVIPPPGFAESNTQNNRMSIQIGGVDSSGNPMPGGLRPHKTLRVQWVPVNYQAAHVASSSSMDRRVRRFRRILRGLCKTLLLLVS
ncbi:MAG: hypothetical protein ACM3ML_11490 [Micromonosporaceae bacterium]